MRKWTFSVPEGYFDDCVAIAAQLPDGRLTTQPLFGLTPRAYPSDDPDDDAADQRPWARFTTHVATLNREAADNVSFKMLFLTRHGQGHHNLRKKLLKSEAECEPDHSGSVNHTELFDALLTPLGVDQARALAARWLASVAVDGLPVPQTLYTSPLARCLQTSLHHFSPIATAHNLPFRPVVKEALRERMTTHPCDRRRSRAWIETEWPMCVLEDGFAEEDVLGAQERAETEAENRVRVLGALEDVFEDGGGGKSGEEVVVVAWTFHSLAMRALLGALGVATFKVQPATTIALLVRGERSEV